MMHDKIASLKESIEIYRPSDPAKRTSLTEELHYLEGVLLDSRLLRSLFFLMVHFSLPKDREDIGARFSIRCRYQIAAHCVAVSQPQMILGNISVSRRLCVLNLASVHFPVQDQQPGTLYLPIYE